MESRLDTLRNSERFYLEEYKGRRKKKYLEEIREELEMLETGLSRANYPATLRELATAEPELLEEDLLWMLNDLRLFIQANKMFQNAGLPALVEMIKAHYSNLTLEEVAMVFRDAKLGKYGKIYDRLDGQVILGWLNEYSQEAEERRLNKIYQKEVQYKTGSNEGRIKPEDPTQFREAKAKFLQKRHQDKKGV